MGASIERDLPVVLTDDEKAESAHKCAAAELELRDLEQELRDTSGGLRKKIKDKKKEVKDFALEAETGKRTAKVPCDEVADWPNPSVVRRLDGRDVDGNKLPPGCPPAVIETKAPEVQEIEGDKARAGEAPNPAQRDLFENGDGAQAGKATPGGDADESVDEEEHEDEDEDGDATDAEDGATDAPPPAAAQAEAKASNGGRRGARKMKLHPAAN